MEDINYDVILNKFTLLFKKKEIEDKCHQSNDS